MLLEQEEELEDEQWGFLGPRWRPLGFSSGLRRESVGMPRIARPARINAGTSSTAASQSGCLRLENDGEEQEEEEELDE